MKQIGPDKVMRPRKSPTIPLFIFILSTPEIRPLGQRLMAKIKYGFLETQIPHPYNIMLYTLWSKRYSVADVFSLFNGIN